MPVRDILLLGNPILRERCSPVRNLNSQETKDLISDLRETLDDFRNRRGFGRGIAAPQIGSRQQIIYLDFELRGPLINPKIVGRSRKRFRLWDDCFSFPDILVQVERNYSVVVAYRDDQGKSRKMKAEGALSELLQHEIDHLHGILAIDRAVDSRHIILRSEFERMMQQEPVAL